MIRKSLILLVMGTVVLFVVSFSSADVPHMISYQGKLTTASGGCLNDTVQMTFSIYPDTLGSPADWSETQMQVVVQEGIFNVLLGAVDTIPQAVFDGNVKYLGVQVETDPEMRPLKAMVSVPYAYRAGAASGGGGDGGWVDDGSVVRLEHGTDKVGIGTDMPETRLEVKSSGYTDGMRVVGSEGNPLFRVRQNSDNAGAIYVFDSTGAKVKITASEGAASYFKVGSLGVGTTSPNSGLQVQGSAAVAYTEVMTDYDLTDSDCIVAVRVSMYDTVLITLPSATGIRGRIYTVKSLLDDPRSVLVLPSDSQTFDGTWNSIDLSEHDYLTVVSTGSYWAIIARGN